MSKNPNPYERNQQQRILTVILSVIFAATFILGAINLRFQTWASVITLFGLSIFCIPAFLLNSRGYTTISAAFISVLALAVININVYEGDGIRDFGLLAYPIFITIGALFFGKRAIPVFTLGAAVSVTAMMFLEFSGYVQPAIGQPRTSDLITILILFGLASTIVWVTIGTMENNLRRLKESEAELLATYELTLEAWAKVMELRDSETEGHSRRLVELSTRLARALGVGKEEITHLRRGALLHDIGKLAVPDTILLKPAALDENDRRIIQKHPGLAKDLLAGIPFLQPSISVVYSHHERWDGKGYPQGLRGEDIPLLARIFAVVDSWDALGSDRIYRPAWPREKIMNYLKENAGSIFDPHIVNVFLKII